MALGLFLLIVCIGRYSKHRYELSKVREQEIMAARLADRYSPSGFLRTPAPGPHI